MPTWDELFLDRQNRWEHPDESVVEFATRFKGQPGARLLDLGCGAGRHAVYLARLGYDIFGIDISELGLQQTQERLHAAGLDAHLELAEMASIPAVDCFFDGVISIHVIFHATLAHMRAALAEIHRVLVPGGIALVPFQSKRGFRFGNGEEIEPDTSIPTLGTDAGIPHHYSDLAEFDREMAQFVVLNVNLCEIPDVDPRTRSSHWEVVMAKPK